MSQSKWIIVSNRLPFTRDDKGKLHRSSGGLVTAISAIQTRNRKIWVGTAPANLTIDEWKTVHKAKHKEYAPVFVSPKTYDRYYNGMANNVFWPLFHYEGGLVRFQWEDWAAYRRVNEMFADAIAKIASPGDLIWLHDFHLFLLPRLLRRKRLKTKIGFFLHIPFPSSELFRQLPVRKEILKGLLGADLIGFHDHSYLQHFGKAVQSSLGIDTGLLSMQMEKHRVSLGVFPVSVDTPKIVREAGSDAVAEHLKRFRSELRTAKIVLGVDRLDYSKGVELKLRAFQELLRRYPEFRKKVTLFQIAVPTRLEVAEYTRLKQEVERLVGEINGEFSRPNHVPVQYMYSSVPFKELLALYRQADVMLVTSKRDGMNLVALEYIAAQDPKNPGVTLLSEFTGAISTLAHVTPVNPWDIVETATKLAHALKVGKEERIEKNKKMVQYLSEYTATDWAESFMSSLSRAGVRSREKVIEINAKEIDQALRKSLKSKKLLLMMDYDGTIVPIAEKPEEAVLNSKTRSLIRNLARSDKVELVVVSGRDSEFLLEQFSEFNIPLAAEHGAKYYNPKRERWESRVHTNKQRWYSMAMQIMKDYTARVPGSFIERKEYSISWHFRTSPREFAGYQSRKLKEELEMGLSNYPVTVLAGKKVIEARTIEANKGAFTRWYLQGRRHKGAERIMIVGDDQTDEDLFSAGPDDSITIKIGEGNTVARYRLPAQEALLPFINRVVQLL